MKREPALRDAVSGRIELRWNIGSGSHHASSAVSENRSFSASPVRTIASWLSGQPFGIAVVPDVYIMIAGSRTRTASAAAQTASGGTDAASSSKRFWSTSPGGEDDPSITQARSAGAPGSESARGSSASEISGRALWSRATKSTSGRTSLVRRAETPESATT